MAKRKAKDVFESAEKTKEHAYVIFPGEEMSEVTLEGSNSGKEAKFDFNQIRQLYETGKIEGYFCLRKTKKTKKVGYTPMYKDKIDRGNPELTENVKEIAQETSK